MAVTVGVRELRSNLRAYLQRIRAGEEVIVTDRGEPVARLTPVEPGETTRQRLIEEGLLTPARRPKTPIDLESLPRMRSGKLSDIVIEQRGSRPI